MLTSHNKKKARPLYKRYIKGLVLEVFGLKELGEFDSQLERYDIDEKAELISKVCNLLDKNENVKLLCLIPSQESGLPHLTIERDKDILNVKISNSKINENIKISYTKTQLSQFIEKQYEQYPELWLAKLDKVQNSYYVRWSFGYQDDREEDIEIIYYKNIRKLNALCQELDFPYASLKRNVFGFWKLVKSNNQDILKIANEFIFFLESFREKEGLKILRQIVEKNNAQQMSLDFILRDGKFVCNDLDCSIQKKIVEEAKDRLEKMMR